MYWINKSFVTVLSICIQKLSTDVSSPTSLSPLYSPLLGGFHDDQFSLEVRAVRILSSVCQFTSFSFRINTVKCFLLVNASALCSVCVICVAFISDSVALKLGYSRVNNFSVMQLYYRYNRVRIL